MATSSASSGRVTKVDGAFAETVSCSGFGSSRSRIVRRLCAPPKPAALYRDALDRVGRSLSYAISGPQQGRRHQQGAERAQSRLRSPTVYSPPLSRIIDKAARELGIDPVELRLRNIVRAHEFPYDKPAGSRLESGNYEKCIALALEKAGYQKTAARTQ